MPTTSESIATRALGQYPISVATSLAIESACGIHPEIQVQKPPIHDYDELWINVRTLFRNFMGALDHETQGQVFPDSIFIALHEEMEQIKNIIRDVNSRVKVVYYYSNYKGMGIKYSRAQLRTDNTPKQKLYADTHNETMKLLFKHYPGTVEMYDLKIEPKENHSAKVLILTHYPYDLVCHKKFGKLVLLESHTGKIKEYAEWTSKYYNGKDLPPGIPFREDLLQILGDKEHFKPYAIKVRQDIIDLANKYNWLPVTTYDKIRYGIQSLTNPYERDVLLSMLIK